MVTPIQWVRTNVVASAGIGVLALALLGGGTAVAVNGVQQTIAEPSPTVAAPSSDPTAVASDPATSTEFTTTTAPDGSTVSGETGGQPPAAGQPDATPTEPPAVVEPPAEPAPVTPGAPSGVSINSDGAGGYTITWADAPMNGLTLAYYKIGVANSSYTSGEEYSSSGGWFQIPAVSAGNNCAFITAVATNGAVGDTASVCTDLW